MSKDHSGLNSGGLKVCQTCQGQSRTSKKIVFLELFLRIIDDEKWNLFEKIGQLRTPSHCSSH